MNEHTLYTEFYTAIKESYYNYLLFGDRSEEKLKPLHAWLGNTIKMLIPTCYDVYFLNGKEVQTEGEYYSKIIDVAIVKKDVRPSRIRVGYKSVYHVPEIEMAISIKFITSNFKQNANNYFENLLGECANLKARGIKFGHFVVFRDKIPYFARNKEIKSWEILDDSDINKYIKLHREKEKFTHAPDLIGMEIIHIDPIVEEFYNRKPEFTREEISKIIGSGGITIQNGISNTNLSEEIKTFVLDNFDLKHFLTSLKDIF